MSSPPGSPPKSASSPSHQKSPQHVAVLEKEATPLSDCPPEILLHISKYLPEQGINALARCNSQLYKWLNRVLYEANIKDRSTALFWAAMKGNESTIKLLISFGVDLTQTTDFLTTNMRFLNHNPVRLGSLKGNALHVAVKFGNLNIANLLVEKGLDIAKPRVTEMKRPVGAAASAPIVYLRTSPLHIAIENRNASQVIFLISEGCDQDDLCSQSGLTPLSYVLSDRFRYKDCAEHLLVIQILLQMGANVNSGGAPGVTPMEAALVYAENGCPENVRILWKMLLKRGADINTPIRMGPWRNPGRNPGRTPLQFASLLGFTDIAAYLLNHGANIEAKDGDDMTPLHYSIALGCLVEGLPIVEQNEWEDTVALFDAHYDSSDDRFGWHGNVETVKSLLEHGADPDATYRLGKTAHTLAADKPNHLFRAAFGDGLVSKKIGESGDKEQGSPAENSSSEGPGGEGIVTTESLFGVEG